MGHFQWLGFRAVPFAARGPVDRLPDRRRLANRMEKRIAAVPPCTADGRPDLSGWCVTEPNFSTEEFRLSCMAPKEGLGVSTLS